MSGLMDDETYKKLLEIITAEVKRLHNDRVRNAYLFNWFFQETQAYNRQQRCNHLKGQIGGPRCITRDYNVAMHTFPTGETKIWCLSNCGWHVWNRPGWSFKWAIGLKMINNTTNRASTSEIPGEILKRKQQVIPGPTTFTGGYAVYQDRVPPGFGRELKPKESK